MQETDDRNPCPSCFGDNIIWSDTIALLCIFYADLHLKQPDKKKIRHFASDLERYGLVGTGNTCTCMYIFTFLPAHARHEFLYGSKKWWFLLNHFLMKFKKKSNIRRGHTTHPAPIPWIRICHHLATAASNSAR